MRCGRGPAAALLLAAALALSAASAAAETGAGEWGTCGGLNGPNRKDAAGLGCPGGYSCVRQDEYYWQCKEDKSVPWRDAAALAAGAGETTPAGGVAVTAGAGEHRAEAVATRLAPWAQCGGISNRAGGKDAQWEGAVCPDGYACIRQDE